jgi:hypothetical protein
MSNKFVLAMVAAAFAALSIRAEAETLAWPEDFDDNVAALVAAAAPSGSAVAEGTLATAFDSFAYSSLPSASFGSDETPFDSCWISQVFSDAYTVTGVPIGIMLFIR